MSNQWRYHAAIRRKANKQRTDTMATSKDRVRFKIDTYSMSDETRRAFRMAFGVEIGMNIGPKVVLCRPSQFARFLIHRNTLGGRNSFKELDPQLITLDDNGVIDVSDNDTDC